MKARRTPVLIVGAGYAGLTAALLLAWRGVPCTLVERHKSVSPRPKAHGLNRRSMEALRVVEGLEADLYKLSRAAPENAAIIIAESVMGREISRLLEPGAKRPPLLSPVDICHIGQNRVETTLLRYVRALGVDVRFSTAVERLSQEADQVTASLRDLAKDEAYTLAADYVVAADGANSAIRSALGIEMIGDGAVSHAVSILFEADLAAPMRGRGTVLYYLRNPAFIGAFVSCDEPGVGQINIEYDSRRQAAADFDENRCRQMARDALGIPNLHVKILDRMTWTMAAQFAGRMSTGRIFLAGDAAHVMPPVGGLAGQTAIQDAADIAWKLAFVYHGDAGPALLETYEAERLPVAQMTVSCQIRNYVERLRPDRDDLRSLFAEEDYLSVAMGYRYRSPAIVLETPDDRQRAESPLRPSGLPGTRLAHIPLQRDGVQISTHDLVGREFALLAAPGGDRWIDAAQSASRQSGSRLATYQIGVDLKDEAELFSARTGLRNDGAILVRPDGFIGWRSRSGCVDPAQTLNAALRRMLCLERAAEPM
ncbi:methanobactin biosynthesis FAD monooxygenase MbnF [Methylocystis sp. S23]